MRKLIAFLLVCVLSLGTLSLNTFGYTDIDDSEHRNSITLLTGLGVINGYEDKSFRPDEIATRAEFAVMISRLLNMESITSGEGKPYFTDVSGDNFAKGAISYCVEAGIMSGYGNGIFKPDKPVSYDEVVKTLVNVLGYRFYAETQGEYPFGYRIQAKKIGLLSGIESKSDGAVTRGEICTLMYNALKIPLLEITCVGDSYTMTGDAAGTILTKYFQMNIEKGIINSDGITKIEYVNDVDESSVVLNNISLKKNGVYNDDFLGKSVEAIYTLANNENPGVLISIVENSKLTGEFSLSSQDIISLSPQKIIYEDDGREAAVYISPTRKVIYNGVFDFTYDLSGITAMKNTEIVFVDNNGDNKYDIIKVNEADNYIIMDKIGEKLILRDITDGSKTLNPEDFEIVEIYDENKNRISEEEFKGKSVNIASVFRNGNYYAKIVIANESFSGVVSYIEDYGDDARLMLGDDMELILNDDCKTENAFQLKAGDSIAAYTDINGTVCYIKLNGLSDYKLGYLMTIKPSSSFEGNMMFKIFTRSNKVEGFECADMLNLNDNMLNVSKYETNVKNTLYKGTEKGYSQFILYMTDDEGKLTEIHQCAESAGDSENKFYKFSQNAIGRFSTGTYSFGGVVNTDNATWFIRVPAGDAANATEEDFSTYRTSQIVSESYPIEYYVTSLEKQVADIVCFTGDKVPMSITYDEYLCVLDKAVKSVDSEGSIRTKLRYYSNGKEYEKFVGYYANSSVNQQISEMEPGEVFSMVEDNAGEIMAVERYYSLRNGWVGALTEGKSQTNTYGTTRRIAAYYVARISGGYARCSFEPVIADAYNAQMLESFKLPGNSVYTLVRKAASGDVAISSGSEKDISLLDLVITRTRGGSDREVIIIKK